MSDPLAPYRQRRARLEQRQAEVRARIQRERDELQRQQQLEAAQIAAVRKLVAMSRPQSGRRIRELFAREPEKIPTSS